MATLHDVIARIPGSTWPDEWVIHGNHHDAWVNGSMDPDQRHGGAARGGPRPRRDAQEGLEAEAHHHPLRLGRRGARPARLDRVGRNARRRSSGRRPWPTSTPTRTCRGYLVDRGLAQPRGAGHPDRPGHRGPGPEDLRGQARPLEVDRRREDARGTEGSTRANQPADSGARLRLRLHPLPPAPGRRLAQHGFRRRGRTAASTTPSTTTSPGTRALPTPTLPTAAPSRRRRARR